MRLPCYGHGKVGNFSSYTLDYAVKGNTNMKIIHKCTISKVPTGLSMQGLPWNCNRPALICGETEAHIMELEPVA